MNINSEDTINELYQEYWAIHAKMIDKEHSPLEIAAILMAQSLSMYKTMLDTDEYYAIIDNMVELRDTVQELTPDQQYYQ
jgi:hypothetical protein